MKKLIIKKAEQMLKAAAGVLPKSKRNGNRGIALMTALMIVLSSLYFSVTVQGDVSLNAVVNGGFEDGLWHQSSSFVLETDAENVHSGSNSAKIVQMHNDNFYAFRTSVDVSGLDSEKTYAFTMWAKAESFSGKVYLNTDAFHVQPGNMYGTEVYMVGGSAGTTLSNSGWVKYTTVIDISKNPTVIMLYADGTGSVWIDDIDVVEISNGIIKNGGMEMGAWGANDGGTTATETNTDYVHSGEQSMKIVSNDKGYAESTVSVQTKDFDFANKSYYLSMWAKADSFNGYVYTQASPLWHAEELNGWNGEIVMIGSGSKYSSASVQPVQLTSTGWVRYVEPIRLNGTITNDFPVRLFVRGSGTVWIDDIDIVEISDGIIKNGGMEMGMWNANEGVNISAETKKDYVNSGEQSLKITAGSSGFASGTVSSKAANLDFVNRKYYLSFWAKADSFNGFAYIQAPPLWHAGEDTGWYGEIQMIGEGSKFKSTEMTPVQLTDTGWVRYIEPVRLHGTASADFNIRLFVRGTGTIWVDDIDLIEISDSYIKNSEMEEGIWSANEGFSSSIETEASNVHSGSQAMKIAASDKGYALGTVSSKTANLDFSKNTYYLAMWVKAESFNGFAYFQAPPLWHAEENTGWYGEIGMIGGGSKFKSTEMTPVQLNAMGWVRYIEPVRLHGTVSGDFDIRLFVRGSGTIWVDDIDLIEIAGESGSDNSLIKNGKMELGSFSGNEGLVPEDETNPDYVHGDAQSMKITSTNSGFVSSRVSAAVKDLDFLNKTYYLSFWAKADDFNGYAYIQAPPLWHAKEQTGYYGEIALIGSGSKFKSDEIEPVQLTDTGWVRYAEPIRLNGTVSSDFDIRLFVRGSGTIWIDDVDIIEITSDGIIKNGDMESGAWAGADGGDAVTESSVDYVHDGVKSAKITSTDAGYIGGTVSVSAKDLDFSNKTYYLSMWAKADSFNGHVYVQAPPLWHADEDTGWYGEIVLIGVGSKFNSGEIKSVPLNNTGWVQYYQPVRLTDDITGDFDIRVFVRGSGTIWIDDIDLVEMDIEPDKNLLSNGSFEDGAWGTGGGGGASYDIDLNEVKDGYLSFKINGTNEPSSELYAYNGIRSFDSSKRYTLSMWIKTENVAVNGARVMALQIANGQAVSWLKVYNAENIIAVSGTTEWTKYTIELTGFSAGVTDIWLYIRLHGPGTVWYDDVRVTEYEFDGNVTAGEVTSTLSSGAYPALTTAELLTGTPNTDIYYTVDGSNPNTSNTRQRYDRTYPIIITDDFTLKACVWTEAGNAPVAEYRYTCSAPLIPDGSFETGLWNGADSGFEIDTDTPGGIGSARSARTAANASQKMETAPFRIDGRYDYRLTFWMKTSGMVADSAGISIKTSGDFHRQMYEGREVFASAKADQGWTKYTYDLKSVAYPDLAIVCFVDSGGGTAWFDGFSLTAVQKTVNPVKFEVLPDVSGNIYALSTISSQKISNNVRFTNLTNAPQSYVMSYNVKDAFGKTITVENIETGFAPRGIRTESLDLSAISQYGTYTVEITVSDFKGKDANGENILGNSYSLGRFDVGRIHEERNETGDNKLGISVHMQNTPSAKSLEELIVLKQAGVKWIRTDCVWDSLETSRGDYSQIAIQLDSTINNAKSLGLNVLLVIAYNNGLYNNDTYALDSPEEHEGYKNFCAAVASHFKGRVDAYEIWNEWNYGVGSSAEDTRLYTEALKTGYNAVKGADAGAIVIGGVTSGADYRFVENMMKNGAGDYMDAVSVHPYSQGTSPEAAGSIAACERIYDMVASYGKNIPLWITEIGWPTAQHIYGSSELEQMQYTLRMIALAQQSSKISKIILYQGTDASTGDIRDTENFYGIFRSSPILYAAKPVYAGISGQTAMLNGSVFKRALDWDYDVRTYEFTGIDGQPVIAVWSTAAKKEVELTLSGQGMRLYDCFGNAQYVDINEESKTDFVLDGTIKYISLRQGTSIKDVVVTDFSEKEDTPYIPPEEEKPKDKTEDGGSGSDGSDWQPSPGDKTEVIPADEFTLEKLMQIIGATEGEQIVLRFNKSDNVVLTPEMLKAIQDTGKSLKINIMDNEELVVMWTFAKITDASISFNPGVEENTKLEQSILNAIGNQKAAFMFFKHKGLLPGNAEIVMGNQAGFAKGERIHFYFVDMSSGTLKYKKVEVVLSADGNYLRFFMNEVYESVLSVYANSEAREAMKQEEKEKNTDSEDVNIWLIVGISAAGFVILAGGTVGVIFFIRKKKR